MAGVEEDRRCHLTAIPVAQRCNEYVLCDILEHLRPTDLAAAALLCRAWLSPARYVLYRKIHVNTTIQKSFQLCSTLHSSAHLRSLVRHLIITHRYSTHDGLLSWIGELPEHSVTSLNLVELPFNPTPSPLLQYPAVRTVSQLTIGQPGFLFWQSEALATILAYPFLESFAIVQILLKNIPVHLNTRLKLKRLSLGVVGEECPPLLTEFFRAMEPCTLERLHLLLNPLRDDRAVWLIDLLRPQLPSLKNIAIRTQIDGSSVPIFDDFVDSMPNLQALVCGAGSYTAKMFKSLPDGIHRLTLEANNTESFPREELSEAIVRLGGGTRKSLRRLTIVRYRSNEFASYFRDMSILCSSLNVSFTIERSSIGSYMAMGSTF